MSMTLVDGRPQHWARHGAGHRLLLALATAAVLTSVAPLHTAGLPWLTRAAEFAAAALIWEVAMVAARAALSRTAWWGGSRSALELAIVVVTASIPATAAIAAVLSAAGEWIAPLATFYAESLPLGLMVAFARRGLETGSAKMRAADRVGLMPVAPRSDAAFLRNRAPRLAGSRLLALEAEDHYLRVHSDRGSELILLRMRDAVDELGSAAGWKPHRSFWLSAGAGGRAVRRGQAWQIVLDNGLMVPVSKTAVDAMRSAGYGVTTKREE